MCRHFRLCLEAPVPGGVAADPLYVQGPSSLVKTHGGVCLNANTWGLRAGVQVEPGLRDCQKKKLVKRICPHQLPLLLLMLSAHKGLGWGRGEHC